MSNDVDMLLKDTLRDRAQAVPAGTGLLARVHTRSRLLRRRRRAGMAGAGVAAVVLAAGTAPVVYGLANADGPSTGVVPGAPSRSASGGQVPSPSGEPSEPTPTLKAVLGRASVTVPAFPFEPPAGVVPGLGPARAMVDGEGVFLSHQSGEDKPAIDVHLGVDPSRGMTEQDGVTVNEATVRVRGVEGNLRTITKESYTTRSLSWQDPSGPMWVRAERVEPNLMIAYADALRPGSVEVAVPFTFELLPQGLELDNVGPTDMVFRLPGQQAGGSWVDRLAILLNADGGDGAQNWPLRVGDRPAQIVAQDGGRSLMVLQESGNILVIQVPPNLQISDEDLLRMAAGIRVTAKAQAGRG
jgi:hypothetical protein